MLEIKLDPNNTLLAAAIGRALIEYAGGVQHTDPKSAGTVVETAGAQVKTTAADTATAQDDQAADDQGFAHGATGQDGSADTSAPADAGTSGADDAGKNDPASAGGDQTTTGASQDKTAGTTTASDATNGTKDEKGVTKDDKYCASAKDPFYGSGKKRGQWKKRQGVDEAEYDAWYAEQLAAVTANSEPEPKQEVDTGAVFGNKQADVPEMPANGGALMAWVSEQQNAGKLTQDDLDAAYSVSGVTVGDLFNPALQDKAKAALFLTLTKGSNDPETGHAIGAFYAVKGAQ